MSIHAQFQGGTDCVGATTRGHDFLVGGHECWAHDTGPFKATSAAVTLLQVAYERTIFECEREHGLEWELQRSCEVFSQMIVDSMWL